MSTATQSPKRLDVSTWRRHGSAGHYVIPFPVMLAATGLILLLVSSMTDLNGDRARITPGTAEVVATFPWRAGWYGVATESHGTLLIGSTGDWLIEGGAT